MDNTTKTKKGVSAWYHICPIRHTFLLLSLALILAHLLTRSDHALNVLLSERFVRPVHRALSTLCSGTQVSVAEILLLLAFLFLLALLLILIGRVIRRKLSIKWAYQFLITLAAFGFGVYAGFCLLWGVYYYGDDFASKSGLKTDPISAEELETVTAYFAGLANQYVHMVPRDDDGVCASDRDLILEKSPRVYQKVQDMFPCLEGPPLRAKGIFFSRLLSYTDFTGFFFPFTAEANVNTDFPPSLFAATVAHELAHQRGVAKEEEANFVAVLASLTYEDPDYCYSACLLAYTHLGNALYGADREAWERIYDSLDEDVLKDFAANREYWKQFETPVQTVSNTVYENFLYSYDQNLGLHSYGACVDLLVNYYYRLAESYQAE